MTTVVLSHENEHFKYLDEGHKVFFGKSKENLNHFDPIVFACRDISSVSIPSIVKYIKTFAFYGCDKLKSVTIDSNSELVSIERNTFSNSALKNIFIPKSVKYTHKKAFLDCKNLSKIEFDKDCQLFYIGDYAFAFSIVQSLTFPANVTKVSKVTLSCYSKLNLVIFMSETFFID